MLSERLSGRSKSDEHRVAIAVAQRKRAASARVLQAIEASHRCDATGEPWRYVTKSLPVSWSCYQMAAFQCFCIYPRHCCYAAWAGTCIAPQILCTRAGYCSSAAAGTPLVV